VQNKYFEQLFIIDVLERCEKQFIRIDDTMSYVEDLRSLLKRYHERSIFHKRHEHAVLMKHVEIIDGAKCVEQQHEMLIFESEVSCGALLFLHIFSLNHAYLSSVCLV
jgi:hypothetical protein